MRVSNLRNPMGFSCAPNACGPDVAIEHDFRRFVAFGLLACHDHLLGNGSEALDAKPEDVSRLRKHFLDELRIALDNIPHILADAGDTNSVSYQGDHDGGSPVIPLKHKGSCEDLVFCWRFERLDLGDHPCLLFVMSWGEPDDFAIWLSLDAVFDRDSGATHNAVERPLSDAESLNCCCADWFPCL